MTSTRIAILIGGAAALLGAPVIADEAQPAAPARELAGLAGLGGGKPLTTTELGEQRAKAKLEVDKITINAQEQDGGVAGNAAINTVNGGNSIRDGAFVNASGFVNAVQNTGNNVLIQSSTIINVSVEP